MEALPNRGCWETRSRFYSLRAKAALFAARSRGVPFRRFMYLFVDICISLEPSADGWETRHAHTSTPSQKTRRGKGIFWERILEASPSENRRSSRRCLDFQRSSFRASASKPSREARGPRRIPLEIQVGSASNSLSLDVITSGLEHRNARLDAAILVGDARPAFEYAIGGLLAAFLSTLIYEL